MAENSIFSAIEKFTGEQIPKSLIYILSESGFSSTFALKTLNSNTIIKIEKYFEKNYDKLSSGLIGSIYEEIRPFEIIPGHCAIILSLPSYVDQVKNSATLSEKQQCPIGLTYLLKTLNGIAEKNAGCDPKARRYDETIQYFATYLYMMCGKSCYETLSANLPIPQANTIRKSIILTSKI